jgi:putative acetyltransferase
VEELRFFVADPAAPEVRAVLEAHLAFAHEVTPVGHVHALDVAGLQRPGVTLFVARRGAEVVGTGALHRLGPGDHELKAMHVPIAHRGTGVARRLLDHLLAVARSRRARRVRLETGTSDHFAPARRLYEGAGFVRCPPFAQYTDNPHSVCYGLDLEPLRPLPVLFGPVCAGKSTLLPLVAEALGGVPAVDLDEVAEAYYEEVGRSRAALWEVGAREGDLGAYRWWQAGHPHAVERVLVDHADAVVALGAGHTVFEDAASFARVEAALEGRVPVLVLPSPDPAASVRILRERLRHGRDGQDWILDGVDVLDDWVRSPQNHGLAARTVHTEGRDAAAVVADIVESIGP